MKLIFLSDLHLTNANPIARLDNIEDTWYRKLSSILDYAKKEGASIFITGDFFDRPRDWKTLSSVIKLLEKNNTPIYTIFGQHDQYLYSKDRYSTSLGVLISTGLVNELSNKPLELEEGLFVYGCSWGQELPEPFLTSGFNVLIIHKNLSDTPLFPGHEFSNAETFLRIHKEWDIIVCGDIHRRFYIQQKGRWIANPGPLLRLEATEYNMDYIPKFMIYDTEKGSGNFITIPHEPADKVLTRQHLERKKETESMLDDFIRNVSSDHTITFNFKDNLQEYLSTNKIDQKVIDLISEVMGE